MNLAQKSWLKLGAVWPYFPVDVTKERLILPSLSKKKIDFQGRVPLSVKSNLLMLWSVKLNFIRHLVCIWLWSFWLWSWLWCSDNDVVLTTERKDGRHLPLPRLPLQCPPTIWSSRSYHRDGVMIYIYYDEVCVCLSRKISTSHFQAERRRREVSRLLGLAGRRPALA